MPSQVPPASHSHPNFPLTSSPLYSHLSSHPFPPLSLPITSIYPHFLHCNFNLFPVIPCLPFLLCSLVFTHSSSICQRDGEERWKKGGMRPPHLPSPLNPRNALSYYLSTPLRSISPALNTLTDTHHKLHYFHTLPLHSHFFITLGSQHLFITSYISPPP